MTDFSTRISPAQAAELTAGAVSAGHLADVRAAVIHDLSLMRGRVQHLQSLFPPHTLHAVAIKANPLVEVLRELVNAGTGLEAASAEEVQLAVAAGCPPDRIVFDSPAKTVGEIEAALHSGLFLNADNFEELSRMAKILESHPSDSVIGLRVNPQVGSGSIAATSVATADSKFGVGLSQSREAIIQAFGEYPWLQALHVHVGSQGCGLDLLIEAAARMAELRSQIEHRTGRTVPYFDIGGGLPTAYRSDATGPSLEAYVAGLREKVPALFADDVTLVTEFGRALQAGCGLAVSRVEYVKGRLAVIHLGADFLLRPVYHPQDWPHEFLLLDAAGRLKTGDEKPIDIAGPLCFSGDILGRKVPLPPVEPGDWIVIRDVGAYTLAMWSRHCSRGMPLVLGYDQDSPSPWRVLRRGETPEDVARFWSAEPF